MAVSGEVISGVFVEQARGEFRYNLKKIVHCLEQLSDEDVWWRPFEEANSLQNIVLHLCGNVCQWIISGIGGATDIRNRPEEFADRRPIPKKELVERLTAVMAEADDVLAKVNADCILDPRRIQGFDETVLSAIVGTVTHFVGHTHQIVYIARQRLGNAYRFYWVPKSPEQASTKGQ